MHHLHQCCYNALINVSTVKLSQGWNRTLWVHETIDWIRETAAALQEKLGSALQMAHLYTITGIYTSKCVIPLHSLQTRKQASARRMIRQHKTEQPRAHMPSHQKQRSPHIKGRKDWPSKVHCSWHMTDPLNNWSQISWLACRLTWYIGPATLISGATTWPRRRNGVHDLQAAEITWYAGTPALKGETTKGISLTFLALLWLKTLFPLQEHNGVRNVVRSIPIGQPHTRFIFRVTAGDAGLYSDSNRVHIVIGMTPYLHLPAEWSLCHFPSQTESSCVYMDASSHFQNINKSTLRRSSCSILHSHVCLQQNSLLLLCNIFDSSAHVKTINSMWRM